MKRANYSIKTIIEHDPPHPTYGLKFSIWCIAKIGLKADINYRGFYISINSAPVILEKLKFEVNKDLSTALNKYI